MKNRIANRKSTSSTRLLRALFGKEHARDTRQRQRLLRVEPLEERRVLAGTWTNLAASGAGPANGQMMMLLSDGSVLVQGGSNAATSTIFKLTPEPNTGSYVNGAWSDIDDLNEGRLFYTTTTLPDGRVFAIGGEYPRFTNTAEIYDPIADTWTLVAPIPTAPSSVFLSGAITGASNSNPITITTSSRTSALNNGQQVTITGVGGNTAANGTFTIANLTNNSFDLVGSVGNGAYTAATGNWASVPAAVSQFGDGVIEILPDGQVLAGQFANSFRYNPDTDTWTPTGAKVRGNSSNEETWVILPDHSILTYDIRSSATNGVLQGQRYIPATDTWVDASNLDPADPPAVLSGSAQGNELGPMFLQPDGNVIVFGANGNNAIYNPTTNLWSAAPQAPQKNLTIDPDGSGDYDVVVPGPTPVATSIVATDDPGAMLPNGHILIALSPLGPQKPGGGYSFPLATYIYEYDPVAETFTENTPALPAENAYQLNMLVLPSGQVLLANAQGGFQIYTPDAAVPIQDEWRPVINGIDDNGDGTFTLHGTQLNGISEGANYGDDYMSSTNYPIIRFTDDMGDVFYGRTFDWSNTGVATGDELITATFTLPAGKSLTDFVTVEAIANGIPSLAANIVVMDSDQANLVIRVNPENANQVQVLIDGAGDIVASFPNNSPAPIVVVGDANNNRLVVDETYGNVNTPITFDGGGSPSAPGDRMLVIGSSGDDVLNLSPTALNAATMSFNTSEAYSFFNIQRFAFYGAGANDTLAVDVSLSLTSVPILYDGDNGFQFSGDVEEDFFFESFVHEGHGSFSDGNGFDQLILTQLQAGGPAISAGTLAPASEPGAGQSILSDGAASQNIFFQNLEPVFDLVPAAAFDIASVIAFASVLDASNAITYADGGGGNGKVTIDDFEPIYFSNKGDVSIRTGAGDDHVVINNAVQPTGLSTIVVFAGAGDDKVEFLAVPAAAVGGFTSVSAFGEAGNDVLDARFITVNTPAILNGNEGNDTLTGGRGDDSLTGESGDDTLAGGDPAITPNVGSNTYSGDPLGFDTLLVLGTLANDTIDVNQTAAGTLTSRVAGNTATETISDIKQVNIQARQGNDLIRVRLADLLVTTVQRYYVQGDTPNASDRLIVTDEGLGDIVILRQAPDSRSGRISIAPGAATPPPEVVYDGIERLDIPTANPALGGTGTDGLGRILVFQPDEFELNDNRLVSTDIEDVLTTHRDPNIDPGGSPTAFGPLDGTPGDEDWYEFRAPKIGTFRFDTLFTEIAQLSVGHPGLPGNGNLDIGVYDSLGNLIVLGTTVPGGEQATFSAAAGRSYFLRVRGASLLGAASPAINTYDVRLTEVDLLGPQLFDPDGAGPVQAIQIVTGNTPNANFNLFGPKPNLAPTPLVNGLLLNVRDLVSQAILRRQPGDVYNALNELVAEISGHYTIVGDATGNVAISSVDAINIAPSVAGTVTAAVSGGQFSAAALAGNTIVPGDLVVFSSGANVGQTREVTTFNSATGEFTFAVPFLNAPAVGDAFTVLKIATATIQINFAQPLPDDRFTLVIDGIIDPPGNEFDGESNAVQPVGTPQFPTGDNISGGPFVARFTVDSRAELGSWASGSIYVDTNGNFLFDPTNADFTNRDISYVLGFTSDNIFAGNFVAAPAGVADGFHKLAAYGKVGNNFRWLIDTDNNGVADVSVVQSLFAGVTSVNGMPAAGNFDNNAANGDETVLKVGNIWLVDTNHDFKVDKKLPGTNMVGLPIVGDFDGDGIDDLGAWADNKFSLNLSTLGAIDGTTDRTFTFGFAGSRERPVAANFDGDRFDDLGLWVPDRGGAAPSESAEWYLLVSGGTSIVDRLNAGSGVINFTPTPFGHDLYAQFGDEFGLPVAGNFDPPLTNATDTAPNTNPQGELDVNNDGEITPLDALLIFNLLNAGQTQAPAPSISGGSFVDINNDGEVSPLDALLVINHLNSQPPASPSPEEDEGEGEAVTVDAADEFFANLVAADDAVTGAKNRSRR